MPKTLSAADAKNRFADALRLAEGGELVVITRYRKPVAALLSTDRSPSRATMIPLRNSGYSQNAALSNNRR